MTTDIEDSILVTSSQYADIKSFMNTHIHLVTNWDSFSRKFQKMFRYTISKNMLRYVYVREIHEKPPRELIKKACRSQYGILNVCVFTSPYPEYTDTNGIQQKQMFSCKHNCYYCPSEPGQPRSYLMKEPGVARANDCDFDCIRQFHMRLTQYANMGHPLDKIEFEVSGGTWSEYPREYQYEFIRDGYYAANIYNKQERNKYSLEQEIHLNESADIHIIGLTIETRPDTINIEELTLFRKYNVTRVQIGVQHTNNYILKKVNRGHTIEQSKKAIKLLLDNCFKVDIHLMPMLPYSSPTQDIEMFKEVLHNSDLQVDQWKVYPTSVVPWSVLEKWYVNGKFKPYSNDELFNVLTYMKTNVHPRIRLIRIVRDINDSYILGGCTITHMRQLLLKKLGHICKCIRCRSVKDDTIDTNAKMIIDSFIASDAKEFFIRYVSYNEKVLYGFCRLRLPCTNSEQLYEVKGCALVRELHVYSTMTPVNSKQHNVQHKGIGKLLLRKAECIAYSHKYFKIAVISGVGVRNYYRKHKYTLDDTYMIKYLCYTSYIFNCISIILFNFHKYTYNRFMYFKNICSL
jgi:ELP3 family radical SAM enzyme/protein acetyltransferase